MVLIAGRSKKLGQLQAKLDQEVFVIPKTQPVSKSFMLSFQDAIADSAHRLSDSSLEGKPEFPF